MILNELK